MIWKWGLWSLVAAVGAVAIAAITGALLPKAHRASRAAVYHATPATVFAAITDVAHFARWRSDLKAVELLPDDGHGMRFREVGVNGAMPFRVELSEPGKKLVTRIDDATLAFGGTWTFDLSQQLNGDTVLTITEDGEIYNPIFRFVSHFFMSQTATIERYQNDLGRELR